MCRWIWMLFFCHFDYQFANSLAICTQIGMQSSFLVFFFCFILFACEPNGAPSEFELDWISPQRSFGHQIPLVQRVFRISILLWPLRASPGAHMPTTYSLCDFSFSTVHWFIRKLVSVSSKSKSHWNYVFQVDASSSQQPATTKTAEEKYCIETRWHI